MSMTGAADIISHTMNPESRVVDAPNHKDERSETARSFSNLWSSTTDDNSLTLYGFRRFRTTHLLNLRLLETEIEKFDRKIYQAGLSLGLPSTRDDKLGLKHSKKEREAPSPEDILKPELVSKLRRLLKEYGTLPRNFKILGPLE